MAESDFSEDANVVVIPVDDSLSDGKKETWPLNDPKYKYRAVDDTKWREALAEMWIEDTGAKEEGVAYILEKLPEGYRIFDRPRGTDHTTRDAFLFGHPSGSYFQSRATFIVHFRWLMSERINPCKCKLCIKPPKSLKPAKPAKIQPVAAYQAVSSRLSTGGFKQPRIRRTRAELAAGLSPEEAMAKRAAPPKDADRNSFILGPNGAEGPDYWRAWILQLKNQFPDPVEIEVNQPLNKNWVFGKDLLDSCFLQLGLDATFTPRRGETVLWTREMDGTLEWNRETRTYQVLGYDGTWKGTPQWQAGIITQTPVSDDKVIYPADIRDLTSEDSLANVTNTGFRVECVPDPIADDKSFSKHASYVPLKCIKPMNSWEIFLDKVPREKWHPTVEFALTTTSSFSLLHHQWFRGTWPNARVHSKGVWVGHELLAVKDTIRLKPFRLTIEDLEDHDKANTASHKVTDVMTIKDIWLEWTDCIDDPDREAYAKMATVWIQGQVYTLDKDRLSRPSPFGDSPLEKLTDHEVDSTFNQVGMSEYGDWYRMNGGTTCQITPGSVLGRCYEPVPTKLHFGSFDLDYDLQSVLKARRYSSQVDNRIPEGHIWFFGDNRVETLGLAELNGIEVGPAAELHRQPHRWVSILKINEGIHSPSDVRMADLGETGKKRGRPPKTFEEIGKTSRLVSSGLGLQPDSSVEDEDVELESNSEEGLDKAELTKSIPYKNLSSSESDDKIESGFAAGIQVVIDEDNDEDYTDEE
ncbi:hypothetical protein N7481_000922 [Penicillium waksmanii]|uniref:uncharacterized protein n=1 Tax=Penicillium waksmanii TaxID=69791 RepID=UPI0025486A81|nr:uncharacterized protein N7481_000922 [Penicillium waksmanii]KAJ6000513.1 hypothetical protein N7481_000922 [Penicillium waksmanii]